MVNKKPERSKTILTGERSCVKMQICTLTLLVLSYGSNGIHATDHHPASPRHDDALLHNGPPPLTPDFSQDSSSSGHDPSLSPGLHDDHPDASGLYEPVSYPDQDSLPDPVFNYLHNDSLSPVLYSHPDSFGSHNNFRISRDATPDKAHDFLNHTAIVAHIVNGIALQTGLMNGKIKIDDLVGELLNFGSVAVSDIASFNPTPITTLTSKLKGIQSTLNSKFEKFEEQALNWDKLIKESLTVGDLKKFDNKEYLAAFKVFETFDFETLTAPGSTLGDVLAKLTEVDQIDTTKLKEPVKSKEYYYTFDNLHGYLTELVTKITTFSKSLETLKKTKLITGPTVYAPLEKMIHLTLIRKDYNLAFTNENKAAIKDNLKLVADLSKDSQASTKDISNIANLAVSKSSAIKKQFTHGLPNGLADVRKLMSEVRDPWIGKMTGAGSRSGELSDGLQPLFSINERLTKLNEKLKTISSEKSSKSLFSMQHLESELSNLAPESVDLSDDVLKGYDGCPLPPLKVNLYDDITAVIGKVEKLKKVLDFKLAGLSLTDLQAEIDKFIKFLDFKDITNQGESIKQLQTIVTRIRDTDGLKDIRSTITDVKTIFDDLDVTDMEQNTKDIETQGKIDLKVFDAEKTFHSCLQKLKDNSAKVALAISASQNLRKLNLDEISEVEASVSTITEVSKGLLEIEKLPEAMKKDSKKASTDLNKLPDSLKKSEDIGKSVSSLHDAYVLKDLESEIAQLKSVKAKVDTEIAKITSPGDRQKLVDQWGDHNSEMASLEKTIANVKDFDSKLDVSKAKTMDEYSNPLKDLVTISDSKINPSEKSKVLESLIAQSTLDPNVKPDLEQSKKTLDQLATLDLQFSNHQTQFQSAPSAFKALHDFLTSFLKEDHNQAQIIVEKDNSSLWLLLVYIFGGMILVGVPVGLGIFFLVKHIYYKKWLKDLKQWYTDHTYYSCTPAWTAHSKAMMVMKVNTLDATKDWRVPPEKSRWPDIFCNPATSVWLKGHNSNIHANYVKTARKTFIATQGPMTGKNDTREDFWYMIAYMKAEFIVNLVNPDEMQNGKCGQYYPTNENREMVCGAFKIKLLSETSILKGKAMQRKFLVVDQYKGDDEHRKILPPRKVTHLHYLRWPDMDVPDEHDTLISMMKIVNKSKKPIVVHCSAGVGRTASFIGLQYAYDGLRKCPTTSFQSMMTEIRNARWHAFQTITQVAWVLVGIRKWLAMEHKLSDTYSKDCDVLEDVKERYKDENPAPAPPAPAPAAEEAAPAAAPAQAQNQQARQAAAGEAGEQEPEDQNQADPIAPEGHDDAQGRVGQVAIDM